MFDRETFADFMYDTVNGSDTFIGSRFGNVDDEKIYEGYGEKWEFVNIMPEDVLKSFNVFTRSLISEDEESLITEDEVTKERTAYIRDYEDGNGGILGVQIDRDLSIGSTVKTLLWSDITKEMALNFDKVLDFVKTLGYKGIDYLELNPDFIGKFTTVYFKNGYNKGECVITAVK